MKKRIAVLGSTGSIGTQTLEVIRENPELFDVEVLTANSNVNLLIKQAIEFKPRAVAIADEKNHYRVFKALLGTDTEILAGEDAVSKIVALDSIDMVLVALVGYNGLLPTIQAIKYKKDIALANKEALVIAGEMITRLAKENKINIYPVDSEHSAIFQCLMGESKLDIEKVFITASGGPFRGKSREELIHVTKQQALNHPNWNMGNKITIDSASLMNKGLEVIEARWLFDLKPEQIDVIIHPQSIVHSLVQFKDGSMKAQMGLPDMKLPILFALSYPMRVSTNFPRFSFTDYPELTFEQPDIKIFRNLALAFIALDKGGNMPCIINAANEVAVNAFLNDRISFLQISEIIEQCMTKASFIKDPSYEDFVNTNEETRNIAENII